MMQSDPHLDPQTSRYHLDKRINVGFLLAVALAILTGIGNALSLAWFLSSFATATSVRQAEMERRIALTEDFSRKLGEAHAQLATAVAVNSETTKQLAILLGETRQQMIRPPAGGR